VQVDWYEVAGEPRRLASRVRTLAPRPRSVESVVREIVASVRADGDLALHHHTRELDTGGKPPPPLRVEQVELGAALAQLAPEMREALALAIENVRAVALAGIEPEREVALPQGQRVKLREVPVRRAAVYAPGGRAPYPSTVVMGAVTAAAAGVDEVVVCTPPTGGSVHPMVLATCVLCGVGEVYRMGGAQAIAALAYGTETVAPVDVIVGPGNPYVTEAKRQVHGHVGIDGFAGPSELLIVLDGGVDLELAAQDMLAQAEHGPDSQVVAVAPDAAPLDVVAEHLGRLGGRGAISEHAVALVDAGNMEDALAFSEAYAPEHLQLMGPSAEALAPSVRSAGCVFVGSASGTAFGDYVAGSNHVLPTGGAARFASVLSPRHFRRRMSEVHVGSAAAALARAGATIARAEGFVIHARSMEARIGENQDS